VDTFLSLTVSGLATAAIYAVAASGLVLTYTTTGTFNFAHGAIGMISAFLYWQLRFDWGWPTPVALVAVLLVAGPLFGMGLERVVMRRLEGTSEITRLVVTIALLLGLLGLSVFIWDPGVGRPMRNFFAGNVVEVGGIRIPWHQFVALAVAAAVAVGLRILLYRTRSGVAMRASVDNRTLAALNGARPERSAMLAWAIGCSLAALSGILIAPTLTLSAIPLTLLIINAYGAAVFGRLKSLPMTFVGALVLGLLNDYAIGYLTELPDDLEPYFRGFVAAIPAILLFVVLLVMPASRLGGVTRSREISVKPGWGGSLGLAAAVVIGTAMITPLLRTSDLVSIGRVWGLAIIGVSMVPLIGLCGQLSLCQLTFAAWGAIAYAHLQWDNPLALGWAALVAGAVGALVALPALRLKGIYVALATAAFAVLCDRWLFQFPPFSIGSHEFDLFQNGTLEVVRPRLPGVDFSGPKAYFLFASIVFALALLAVVAVRRSTFGERLIAIKEGPAAVATCGIDVNAAKVAVFALSAAIAGVGGAVLSGAEPANNSTFDFVAGLPVLMVMVIGGVASVGSAIATGIFLGSPLMSRIFPGFERWQNILVGFSGVGLGKNPNGFTADLRRPSTLVKRDPVVLVGMLVALLALWGMRTAELFTNGPYVVASLAVLLAAPIVAGRRAATAAPVTEAEETREAVDAARLAGAVDGRLSAPPELLGLTAPFQDTDVAVLDEVIDLVEIHDGGRGDRVRI
jgi:branched-chain amino acid transport system permease protein